jgi:hypothetical protein
MGSPWYNRRKNTVSAINPEKAFDRAIDLVINQDHVAFQWTGRYIAVQAGLGIAAAAVLTYKGPHLGTIEIIIAALLAAIAIVLTIALTGIIVREYEWQKRYVEMVRRAEGNEPLLYQTAGKFEPLPGRDIPGTFAAVKRWVIGAWSLFVVVVVLYFLATH